MARHPIAVSMLPGSHPFGWLNFLKFRQNHPPKSVVKRVGFIPGLRLSELFFQQEVRPILDKHFPPLRYSAALIGWGSEVLGVDTPLSRDYPKDVWLRLLAAQWTAISEEEAFVGRTGHVGDELGSRVITARLVHEIIKLSFLMERQYAPYSKWLGTAFGKLPISKKLAPMLNQALRAKTWKSREKWLAKAYLLMVQQHNALKITRPVANVITNYYNRPYKVIFADRVAAAIKQAMRKPKVKGN